MFIVVSLYLLLYCCGIVLIVYTLGSYDQTNSTKSVIDDRRRAHKQLDWFSCSNVTAKPQSMYGQFLDKNGFKPFFMLLGTKRGPFKLFF